MFTAPLTPTPQDSPVPQGSNEFSPQRVHRGAPIGNEPWREGVGGAGGLAGQLARAP